MRSWIFYPRHGRAENPRPNGKLIFAQPKHCPTREELKQFMPESRDKSQRPSLGFYCGHLAGDRKRWPELLAGLSPWLRRGGRGKFRLTAEAMNFSHVWTLDAQPAAGYRWTNKVLSAPAFTAPGVWLPGPPDIHVHCCRSFRFSPYLPASAQTANRKKSNSKP